MIKEAIAGTDKGSTRRKKTVTGLAPSISADSNRSCGRTRKKFASR